MSITELGAGLPMSRQAVTKHLRILERAGLIAGRTSGRERIHALRAEPLRMLGDWLAPYEAEWDERLAALKAHVDGPSEGGQESNQTHDEGVEDHD